MAKYTKIILFAALFCTMIYALVSCASQIGPGGGEVDKIPPEIVQVNPANRTINFDGNSIEIEFSEYVEKRSAQEAIFISPSITGKIEYDWGGKSLELIFEDSLKKNITYTVTIGTDVVDLNNKNRMKNSFSFTFSTGNEIDYCSVSGKVYEENAEGTFVFAYMLNDTIPNPSTQKPDYLSQVGEKGTYQILGMAPAGYRLFAINDSFRDMLYNLGEDKYGCANRDVILTKQDSSVTGIDFLITSEDTLVPGILNVTMTDKHHMLVEFSEALDSSLLSASNFSVYDSTSQKAHYVDYLYKGKNKAGKYFLSFKDTLIAENENYLNVSNFIDKNGNVNLHESVSFVVSAKVDTVSPRVSGIETEYPSVKIDYSNPYLMLSFDDALNMIDLDKSIRILDRDSVLISNQLEKIDDALFKVTLKEKIKPKFDYKIIVDYKKLTDAAGNAGDTIYTGNFSTINELDFSALSGTFDYKGESQVSLILNSLDEVNVKYQLNVSDKADYKFERVRPGKYLLHAFIDTDKNSKLKVGKLTPFEFAEKFVFYPDTIKLAARWPVGDVHLTFEN